jgi:hypothetical protein
VQPQAAIGTVLVVTAVLTVTIVVVQVTIAVAVSINMHFHVADIAGLFQAFQLVKLIQVTVITIAVLLDTLAAHLLDHGFGHAAVWDNVRLTQFRYSA